MSPLTLNRWFRHGCRPPRHHPRRTPPLLRRRPAPTSTEFRQAPRTRGARRARRAAGRGAGGGAGQSTL